MKEWAEKEAERILDAFVAYEGADDLLRLQGAIVEALLKACENGQK